MPPKQTKLTPAFIEARSIPEPNSGCWIWMGSVGKVGYGNINLRGYPRMSASRASFIAYNGTIDSNLDTDHICRTPLCVNPDHLQAISHKENCQLRSAIVNTCQNGHLFDGINSRGHRICKTCANLRAKKYRQQRKG